MFDDILILLAMLLPPLIWGIYALKTKVKGAMTAHATIKSRRVEYSKIRRKWSDNWNRLITFQLKDGSELELYVSKEEFETLKDGQSGQITWENNILTYFDPDSPL